MFWHSHFTAIIKVIYWYKSLNFNAVNFVEGINFILE